MESIIKEKGDGKVRHGESVRKENNRKEYVKVKGYVYDRDGFAWECGNFEITYQGVEYNNKSHKIAIRIIDKWKVKLCDQKMRRIFGDVKFLKSVGLASMVEYIDCFESREGDIYIVSEFYRERNLKNLLMRYGGELRIEKVLEIAETVARFYKEYGEKIREMKNVEILYHGDMNPSNVLIKNGKAVISDFGFGRYISEEYERAVSKMAGEVREVRYMSPQMLRKGKVGYKTDIWSLGVMIYEMIYGTVPWKGIIEEIVLENIMSDGIKFPEKPEIPNMLKGLIEGMLRIEEEDLLDFINSDDFEDKLILDPYHPSLVSLPLFTT